MGVCVSTCIYIHIYTHTHTHNPMFIAGLFTKAKPWEQPKCPLTDEWIKNMWYIYTIEFYSDIKRK